MEDQPKGFGDPNHAYMQKRIGVDYFLGIGINDYQHHNKLNNAVKDVKDIFAVLKEQYGFMDEAHGSKLLFDAEASRANIIKALRDMRSTVKENDRLLIYYSGHGSVEDEIGYWIPAEAEKGEVAGFVTHHDVHARIDVLDAMHILLICDSCFSGSFVKKDTRKVDTEMAFLKMDSHPSRYIFCSGNNVVSDGKPGANSPFAARLLDKLKAQDSPINIVLLADYVTKAVSLNLDQYAVKAFMQTRKTRLEGEFVFFPVNISVNAWDKLDKTNLSAVAAFADLYKTPEAEALLKTLAAKLLQSNEIEVTGNKDLVTLIDVAPTHSDLKNTHEHKTVNGVNFTMIHVEGGTFNMGDNTWDFAKPIHSVTLKSYRIGETPVTQELWRAVMGEDPSELYFKGCDECPVEGVSWNDIHAFLKKLNQLTGETYRLPSEAEWEYAARGGNKSKGYTYSGSNIIDEVAWDDSNSRSKTHVVKTKLANELGIYDMSGNVWEWCDDWNHTYQGASKDGSAGVNPTAVHRVCRGGNWYLDAEFCLVSYRYGHIPDMRLFNLGFRLALSGK